MSSAGSLPGGRQRRPQRLTLDNGLTLIIAEHGGADVAAVQLWVRVGARDEGPGEGGFSHFTEHLLFKGTPRRGPGVIDRTISGLGGAMNAATSQDFTYYHVVVPALRVDTAIDVVSDVARHATLDADELERERLVVLEEIRRAHDDPSASLWRLLSHHHFSGHPYRRPVLGTVESIRGAGPRPGDQHAAELLSQLLRAHGSRARLPVSLPGADPESDGCRRATCRAALPRRGGGGRGGPTLAAEWPGMTLAPDGTEIRGTA